MNKPKLRFKADDGSEFPDWEEKTFNDVADYKKGPFGSALKKEIFVPKSNDTVKVYEQQNAISKDWKLERYFLTNEYFQSKMKSFAVSGGDIIVSCAGTIGEMYELPDDAEEGIINQALMRVRIKKSVINSMIFRCVFDKMISTEGVKISNGSALKNIPPFADMKKQSVFVPSLPEQQKIADCLSSLDDVIEKQKATVSAWEERKKGVMQKLFSQEVRFKADDGSEFPNWGKKRIGECTEFVKDGTHGTHKDVTNGHPLLSAKDIFDNVVHIPNDSRLISDNDYNRIFSKYSLQVGDILITIVGTLGRTALVTDVCKHVAFQRSVGIMRPNKNIIDSSYLKTVCDVSYFQKELEIKKNKGAQAGIYLGVLSDIEIPVPCLAEQQKIADCLSSLDDVIEKQKATLAAWEKLKKGLLQQMFV